jgi:NitT/TauT family transport system ATP-binding protein
VDTLAVAQAVACRALSVRFVTERRTVTALENVSFEIPKGAFLSLLGPSGCGKSTLLRVVADLIGASEGACEVLGGSPEQARRERKLGFVFQDAALLPWRTAIQNVALPLEVGGGIKRGSSPTPHELLRLVGLEGWENAYPHELSGGMRQRVSIARALLGSPQILLMDEPFGALDEITRDRLNEELLRIWQETKTTILFVTHSIYEAAFLGQKVLVLAANPGRVREMVEIDLPAERTLALRDSEAFVRIAARLRALLGSC